VGKRDGYDEFVVHGGIVADRVVETILQEKTPTEVEAFPLSNRC
jgi:hypothetical protein